VLSIGAAMLDVVPDTTYDAQSIFRVSRAPAAGGSSVSVLEAPIIWGAATNSNDLTQPFACFAVDEPEAGDWTYFLTAAYFNTTGTITAKGRLAVVEF
jgi:diaminopimelate decarboxylase